MKRVNLFLLMVGFVVTLSSCSRKDSTFTLFNNETDSTASSTLSPDAPTALVLIDPVVTPGTDTTPTVEISGVVSGDSVKLYTNSNCSSEVGSAVALGTTVEITTSVLAEGSYTFYSNSSNGKISICSIASVSYTIESGTPSISSIADLTIDEDSSTGGQVFTIDDINSSVTCIGSLSKSSDNQTLLPDANIVIGGGATKNCIVTLTPVANQNGIAIVTLIVSDGSLSSTETILLTVTSVADVPTISDVSNQTVDQNSNTGTLNVTIGDLDSTLTCTGSLSGSSDDTTLLPINAANIIIAGSVPTCTITLIPAADQSGTVNITLMVTDGSLTAQDSFVLTVEAPACPTGYVEVPGNAAAGIDTNDFCVMKYEAKAKADSGGLIDSDGVSGATVDWGLVTHSPASVAEGSPWRYITASSAWDECDSLNTEGNRTDIDSDTENNGTYALISNPEWMTIARNSEAVAINWENELFGSKFIQGWVFYNSGPAHLTGPSCLYNTSSNNCSSTGQHKFRRTINLTNDSEIWDLSGNVSEWVDWSTVSTFTRGPTNAPGAWRALNNFEGSISSVNLSPAGPYTAAQGMGQWYSGSFSAARGAAARGSGWTGSQVNIGLFSLYLNYESSSANNSTGFRCVYRPN